MLGTHERVVGGDGMMHALTQRAQELPLRGLRGLPARVPARERHQRQLRLATFTLVVLGISWEQTSENDASKRKPHRTAAIRELGVNVAVLYMDGIQSTLGVGLVVCGHRVVLLFISQEVQVLQIQKTKFVSYRPSFSRINYRFLDFFK